VDELRDTNLAQYTALCQVVGNRSKNPFVVTADGQFIYERNGASSQRLRQIRSGYNMEVIKPPTNYRCPSQVIDLANT
jgi:DNA helicase-2/ATP-dependent DNA helicase PcrA